MIKIGLVSLGYAKHRVDLHRVTKWRSDIFAAQLSGVISVLPDGEYGWQYYQDDELSSLLPCEGVDLTIAITDCVLQDNYYLRRLPGGVIVMSLYEIADICHSANLPIENFIVRNIYELCVLHKMYPELRSTSEWIPDIIHDETRSCLFDMNGDKADIVHSTSRTVLCDQCVARLSRSQLPVGFVSTLAKELKKVRQPLFFRMEAFVKQRPLLSLGIAISVAVLSGVLSSVVYDLILFVLWGKSTGG